MSRRILVIPGHPAMESFCGSLADAYVKGARAAGNEVQLIDLAKLSFDPILHNGYNSIQPLEPDLLSAREAIKWAEHLVFVYPIWWGAMPALLKGFIDRIFLPGFAFKFRDGSAMWDRLLSNRSAHLLVTMDTPIWYYKLVYRMPGHNQMKRTILEFCGIKPVKISSFGPVKNATPQKREQWIAKAYAYGNKA
ncbi:NAD(P)H-dependent oxidoreductase [Chlorobium ferrooxidans]|uniref:NAD(P)H dehydrogenase (Quinone):NADPH-dependent FMN reductase n=1 Tax=Chlorobium ferrooxidans DSM 13031 TaxID=377431 RepID=Q0YUS1_9CHLB|nr:NAD(P)H-dependent oxidoreductase [Chlorobium ferrooxidans]EAT59962.1 NAD(P)H dehydrogenase (quinone):NADPH-dependent FMN reductase [Chlorobium ferrooxidans DSM 13031]